MTTTTQTTHRLATISSLYDHLQSWPKGIVGLLTKDQGSLYIPPYIPTLVVKIAKIAKELFVKVFSALFPTYQNHTKVVQRAIVLNCQEAASSIVQLADGLLKESAQDQTWNEPLYTQINDAHNKLSALPEKLSNFSFWDRLLGSELSEKEVGEVKSDASKTLLAIENLRVLRNKYTVVIVKPGLTIYVLTELFSKVDRALLARAFETNTYFQKHPNQALKYLIIFFKEQRLPDDFPNSSALYDFASICFPEMAEYIKNNSAKFTWSSSDGKQAAEFIIPLSRINALSEVHARGLSSGFIEQSTKTVALDPTLSLEMVQAIRRFWEISEIGQELNAFSKNNWEIVCRLFHYAEGCFCPAMKSHLSKAMLLHLDSPAFSFDLICENKVMISTIRAQKEEFWNPVFERLDRLFLQDLIKYLSNPFHKIEEYEFKDYQYRTLDFNIRQPLLKKLCEKDLFLRLSSALREQFKHILRVKIPNINKDTTTSPESFRVMHKFWEEGIFEADDLKDNIANWKQLTSFFFCATIFCPPLVPRLCELMASFVGSHSFDILLIPENRDVVMQINQMEDAMLDVLFERLDIIIFNHLLQYLSSPFNELHSYPYKDYKFRILKIDSASDIKAKLCNQLLIQRIWDVIKPMLTKMKNLKILFESEVFLPRLAEACRNKIEHIILNPALNTMTYFQPAKNLRTLSLFLNEYQLNWDDTLRRFGSQVGLIKEINFGNCSHILDFYNTSNFRDFEKITLSTTISLHGRHSDLLHFIVTTCTNLKFFDLSVVHKGTPVLTDATCQNMTQCCRNLQTLILKNQSNLSEEALMALVMRLKNLRHLDICGCTQISQKTTDYIRKKYPQLTLLSVPSQQMHAF